DAAESVAERALVPDPVDRRSLSKLVGRVGLRHRAARRAVGGGAGQAVRHRLALARLRRAAGADHERGPALAAPAAAPLAGGPGPAGRAAAAALPGRGARRDRKSTRLNSSHVKISYGAFCLKKQIQTYHPVLVDPES